MNNNSFNKTIVSCYGYPHKILFVMRLILFLIFGSIMQVSATGFAQKVTYHKKEVSLKELFKEITRQTGNEIFYSNTKLNDSEKINVNYTKTDIKDILNAVIDLNQFSYTIDAKSIIIKREKQSLLDKIIVQFKNITVRGVVSNEGGSALVGATVRIKGTGRSTNTNERGEFTLNNVEENAKLLISFIGYEPKEIAASENMGKIQLVQTMGRLDEVGVVSTGYQQIPKDRLTGSFNTITSAQIDKKVSISVPALLEGLVPGYNLSRVGNTGAPATNIRGVSTLTTSVTGNQPLYVIDGFPADISSVNPRDIEDVTFLKDAAAASIWGARASNGVVVITTKKSKGRGLKIDYFNNFSFSGRLSIGDRYMNSSETVDFLSKVYTDYYGAIGGYKSNPDVVPNPVLETLYNREKGLITQAEAEEKLGALRNADNIDQLREHIYQSPFQMQHNLTIASSGERYNSRLSLGTYKSLSNTQGLKNGTTFIGLNSNWELNKYLNLYTNIQANFGQNISNGINTTPAIKNHSPFTMFADANGNAISQPSDISEAANEAQMKLGKLDARRPYLTEKYAIKNRTDLFSGRFQFGSLVKVMPGLNLDAKFQYGRSYSNEKALSDFSSYSVRSLINTYSITSGGKVYNLIPKGSSLLTTDGATDSYNLRVTASYDKSFGKDHQLNAIVGAEKSRSWGNTLKTTTYGYNDEVLTSISLVQLLTSLPSTIRVPAGIPPDGVTGRTATDYRNVSVFSNAGYMYQQKYGLSASLRMDETNLFGRDPNNQYKPIWSFGGKWIASKEDFMKDISWLNQLSVRATYGIGGNIIYTTSPYLVILAHSVVMNPAKGAFIINTPPNDKLTWEKTYTKNFGLDFGLLNNRISGSIDYYRRHSVDVLGTSILNPTLGFSTAEVNVAEMNNDGIEIQLKSENIRTPKFLWNTLFNLSFNKNKIVKNYETVKDANTLTSTIANRKEGYPLSAVFAFQYAGLDATGQPTAYDETGKPAAMVTNADALAYMGTQIPPYTLGLTNSFTYKQLSLQFLLVGNFGGVLHKEVANKRPTFSSRILKDYQNAWWKAGDEQLTNIPGFISTVDSRVLNQWTKSDINTDKSDYVKLRELIVSYNLPQGLLNKIGINSCSINAQARNLWFWAANKDKYDPELIDANNGIYNLPTPVTYALGIQVGF